MKTIILIAILITFELSSRYFKILITCRKKWILPSIKHRRICLNHLCQSLFLVHGVGV